MGVTCFDLFAGAGGLSQGLMDAGINVVTANEIDPSSCNSFRANHPSVSLVEGDIRDIDFRAYKGIDLVAGGPPCQGFSTLGSKRANDFRNSLYMQFVRAVVETECRAFCFENVSGFRSMYRGGMFKDFMDRIDRLGFLTASMLVDAAEHGVPQHRRRTVILGFKPSGMHDSKSLSWKNSRKAPVTLMDAISDLPELKAGEKSDRYAAMPANEYQERMREVPAALTDHECAGYGEKMQEILSLIPEGGCINDLPEHLRPTVAFSNTYARLHPAKPAPTITRNLGTPSSSRCVHPYQDRALSTREGARLQSFPDHYIFMGSKCSKNLQIGNAVPPMLGKVLGEWIIQVLEGHEAVEGDIQEYNVPVQLAIPMPGTVREHRRIALNNTVVN